MSNKKIEFEPSQVEDDIEAAIMLLNSYEMTVVFGRKDGQQFGLQEVRPQDALRAITIYDEDEFAVSKLDPDWEAPRPWEEAA